MNLPKSERLSKNIDNVSGFYIKYFVFWMQIYSFAIYL